jgi:hypothetical protein
MKPETVRRPAPETIMPTEARPVLRWMKRTLKTLENVFYGMTVYDWVRELEKTRSQQDRLFTIMVYGDMFGVPILPPYYSLRLLPFIAVYSSNWRRSLLRERDLTDLIDQEIG